MLNSLLVEPPSQSGGGDRSGIGACGGRLEDNHDRKEGVAKCTRALRAMMDLAFCEEAIDEELQGRTYEMAARMEAVAEEVLQM